MWEAQFDGNVAGVIDGVEGTTAGFFFGTAADEA
jgi:hypothetical protein